MEITSPGLFWHLNVVVLLLLSIFFLSHLVERLLNDCSFHGVVRRLQKWEMQQFIQLSVALEKK